MRFWLLSALVSANLAVIPTTFVARADGEPPSAGPGSDPDRDAPPPDQALGSDRSEVHARFEAVLVVRAPLARCYGASFAYAPLRALAVEFRLGFREDASVELAPGVAVYLFRRPFDGLLIRAAAAVVVSESQPVPRLRVDADLGYSLLTHDVVVEFDLGVLIPLAGGDGARPRPSVSLGVRAGIAY